MAKTIISPFVDGDTVTGVNLSRLPDDRQKWQVITASETTESGVFLMCNTTSAAITVTLPASPSDGDIVGISDGLGTAGTNTITVGRNSSTIMNVAEDMVISTNNASILLTYVSTLTDWRISAI
tara:strand:+ start:223 stop:594 length:372 start_codon:yes stop_codon:yes gene_type:complete